MKVLFVYPDSIGKYEQPVGLLTLMSVVKKAGHEIFLYSFPGYSPNQIKYKAEFSDLVSRIKPQVVAFSATTYLHEKIAAYYKIVKSNSKAVIVEGGIHPTMFPEETIVNGDIDIIGIGECEKSINELLARLERNEGIGCLNGYWYRRGRDIIRNPMDILPDPLDALPFPDRTSLRPMIEQRGIEAVNILSSRGCSFECSYCHNIYLKKYYSGKGKYVRFRSPNNVIQEIKEIISLYPSIKRLVFSDDNFALDKKRLIEICKRYKGEISLPFICHARVENIDDEVLGCLKEANCDLLNLAIETANDRLRYEILNRRMTKEKIINVFRMIKKHGLRKGTFIMLGIPGETRATIWETIRLVRDIKVDYTQVFSFCPLKKTPLYEYCISKGYKIDAVSNEQEFNFSSPVLQLDTISKRSVKGYLKTFRFYVKAERHLFPLIHVLRHLWMLMPEKGGLMNGFLKRGILYVDRIIKKLSKNIEESLFSKT